jgi:apolipoprotein N-acyltransferase
MLRATITGVSALIAPDGSVLGQLGVGEQGVIRALVAGERRRTVYARWPWLPPLVCTLIALAAVAGRLPGLRRWAAVRSGPGRRTGRLQEPS